MIESVDILRVEQGEDGTFGVLRIDGRAWCVTLEPPQRGNMKNVSCIPTGRYLCRKTASNRFGTTFEVVNVPGRTRILLHPGNVLGDTHGCVLLGRHFGQLSGDRGVLDSGRTFKAFMSELEGTEEFPIVINNVNVEAA